MRPSATRAAFTSVTGSWTQPAVTCTTAKTYSSYWVGLDGYNDNTVEQLGTEGDCLNGRPRYYAWFEMYPHQSMLVGVTVTPFHSYSASVPSAGHGTFALHLADVTTGSSFSTVQKANQAQASFAEVIVEAPYSGGTLPLANFDTVNFSAATANGKPLGSNLDRITMNNPAGMKSTPSTLGSGGTSFSVAWSPS
jgi:Peptidase A4 family